ncbi:MAG: hypothetical protein VKP57_05005 [Candidatus Sericytochromatia bacterium]|nr:hypothetical protein [Candidatus Sericytochromatia bacterium]
MQDAPEHGRWGLAMAVHGVALGVMLPFEVGLLRSLHVGDAGLPGVVTTLVTQHVPDRVLLLGLTLPAVWVLADLFASYGHAPWRDSTPRRHFGRILRDTAGLATLVAVLGGLLSLVSWLGLLGEGLLPGWNLTTSGFRTLGLFAVFLGVPEVIGHLWSTTAPPEGRARHVPGGRLWLLVRPCVLLLMLAPLPLVARGFGVLWATWALGLRLLVLAVDLRRHDRRRRAIRQWADAPRMHAQA